jgi:hypothetical protein
MWSFRRASCLLDVGDPLEVVRWANHVREAVRFEMHYVGSPERAEANAVSLATLGYVALEAEILTRGMTV